MPKWYSQETIRVSRLCCLGILPVLGRGSIVTPQSVAEVDALAKAKESRNRRPVREVEAEQDAPDTEPFMIGAGSLTVGDDEFS